MQHPKVGIRCNDLEIRPHWGSTVKIPPHVDFPALMSLASILHSHKSVMTSLSEVVLLGNPYASWISFCLWPSQTNADLHFEATEIWKTAVLHGTWDNTIRAMQSSRRSGVFRGWGIEKEVSIAVWRLPRREYSIKKVKVTFRKAQGSKDLPVADDVVPQLGIEWRL